MTDTAAAAPTAVKRTKERHLPSRTALAVVFTTLFGLALPPVQAAVAVAFALVACFAYERFKAKWYLPLLIVCAALGLVPWWAAASLFVLYLVGVGFVLAVVEVGAEILEEENAFERRVWFVVLAEWLPKWTLLGATVVTAIVFSAWSGVALAAVPVFLVLRRRFVLALGVAIIALLVFGFSPPLVVPLLIAGATIAWRKLALRSPDLRYPLSAARLSSPRFAVRLWRLDRAIKEGRKEDVAALLERPGRTPRKELLLDMRRILVALEERQFQQALDVAAKPHAGETPAALSLLRASALTAVGRTDEALALLGQHPAEAGRVALGIELARAEAYLAAGSYADASDAAERAVSACSRRTDSADRFRAHRLAVEALAQQGLVKEAQAAAERGLGSISTYWWSALSQGDDVDHMLLSARGGQLLELARLVAASERLDIEAGTAKPERIEEFAENGDVAMYFAMAGAWQDYADSELLRARLLLERGRADQAAAPCLSALRELDRHRYELRSQRDRASWSRRIGDSVGLALAIADAQGDAELLAELLELARIQALPLLRPRDGSDDLGVAPAPVIRLRGRAHIARFADARRPQPVDLELAAMEAAGFGAWSLSFWQADARLYWSLIPPTGEVEAGSLAADEDSDLASVLQELREALPASLPDESAAAFDVRMARSPLLADPAGEWRLSTRLAQLLIPERLRHEMMRRARDGAPPLPLAVSPAPQIGFVPWSTLVINPAARGRAPSRLLHYADWVLAPSAALSASLGVGDAPKGPFPLRVAVIDTWQSPELPALEGARSSTRVLPPEVEVLGGRHWSDSIATKKAVMAALWRAGRTSSAVFACHAVRGGDGLPSSSGLVLASDGDEPALLTASDLFEMASSEAAIPVQVYLQACDTSDLASSISGEWLTVAPGFLVAGARYVCSTLFPLLDDDSANDPAIQALIEGEDLREAVRRLQRDGAERWDTFEAGQAGLSASPSIWGAYAISATNQMTEADQAAFTSAAMPANQWSVSSRTRQALASATTTMREMRGSRLSTGDVLAAYLDRETTVTEGSAWRELGVALALPILGRLAGRRLPGRQLVGDLGVTEELLACLRQAGVDAAQEGRPLEIEHLIRVAMREHSAAHRVLSVLNATGIQRRRQIANTVEQNLAEQLVRRNRSLVPQSLSSEHLPLVDALLKAATTADE